MPFNNWKIGKNLREANKMTLTFIYVQKYMKKQKKIRTLNEAVIAQKQKLA